VLGVTDGRFEVEQVAEGEVADDEGEERAAGEEADKMSKASYTKPGYGRYTGTESRRESRVRGVRVRRDGSFVNAPLDGQ
jgi:hypothetical protein